MPAGHTYIYVDQAALGDAAGRDPRRARILRRASRVAGREPGADARHAREAAIAGGSVVPLGEIVPRLAHRAGGDRSRCTAPAVAYIGEHRGDLIVGQDPSEGWHR